MIGIEVFIVTFMSIFCFMSFMYDMGIHYKMGEYGIYKSNIHRIAQMYILVRTKEDADIFAFSSLSIIK